MLIFLMLIPLNAQVQIQSNWKTTIVGKSSESKGNCTLKLETVNPTTKDKYYDDYFVDADSYNNDYEQLKQAIKSNVTAKYRDKFSLYSSIKVGDVIELTGVTP